jgi:hypothetical protein
MRWERLAGLAVVGFVVVARSQEAWALCPNCLGQSRTLTSTLELLGLFLLVPFVTALLVFRAIRRAVRDAS